MRERVLNQRRPCARSYGCGRTVRLLVAGLLAAAAGVCAPARVPAQTDLRDLAQKVGVRVLAEGESADHCKNSAVQAIPFRALHAEGRRRVSEVLENCAQHRSLPRLQYVVEPRMYRYLVEHPDVAVSTWRAMGISRFQMWQTGPYEYEVSASDGSTGIADVIYRDAQQCLFICEGTYNSPLLPKSITASALILLRYGFVRAADGQMLVDQRMDAFIALPSSTAQTIAKLASPLTNIIMDRNLFEVSLYARMMSKAAKTEPGWVEQLAGQLDGVLPQRQTELAALVEPVVSDTRRSTRSNAQAHTNPQSSAQFRIFESSLSRMNAALPVTPPPQGPLRHPEQSQSPRHRGPVRPVATSPTAARIPQEAVDATPPTQVAELPLNRPPESTTRPALRREAPLAAPLDDPFELQDVAPPSRVPEIDAGH